ncbi:MAG: CDP-diacylglycerol--serine O-phosphatidyltransferase [Acidobacteria bacterium]|nr:CDP-diacylglycerol--serine O-phosphatidyltransferase [Acidobacteriota bacterium]MBI3279391.1 CDP-diacylglycerol--serine O-phosphatidyltransferase [Acidobacteriota bacterium]
MRRINLGLRKRIKQRERSRAAYALPAFFTAGNIFLGFVSILKSFQGAILVTGGSGGSNPHFEIAAIMIGLAALLDGLDGRIARMTNTVSDFGRELDSLADVITFGLAPAVLAYAWGVQFADAGGNAALREHLLRVGYFAAFMFVLCGAARLARFNIQINPVPKNPGKPDRKYFVGLPIPAAAALIAAVVYASDSVPLQWWILSVCWIGLLALVSFLMVSTWRYRSFKDISMLRPRSPLTVIFLGSIIYLLWNYSQPMLLTLSVMYVGSGIVVRVGGIVRRFVRQPPAQPRTA